MGRMYHRICLAAAAAVAAVSCNFLKVENVGKSDIEGFFSEVPALQAAMYGIYHNIYSLYDSYLITYPEVASDELVLSETAASWVPFHNFTANSSDESTALGYIWKNAYSVINNINELLHYAPALRESFPEQAATVDNIIGQAYFCRALMHLQLCLCYGQNYSFTPAASHLGVPVVDHILGLTEEIARDKVVDVYAAIIADLNSALKAFPAGGDYSSRYFASPLACKALLARVYLYMGKWADAENIASQAMAARPLTARSAYKALFCTRTPSDDESIFRINGMQLGTSQYKFYYYEEPQARPASRVKDLLTDPDDVRGQLLRNGEKWGDVVMKYCCTEDVLAEDRYYSPIVLRESEMYLIHAEACCMQGRTGDAENDLKALLARATGRNASEIVLQYSDADGMMQLVEQERLRELCFEGHRFWDITRRHADLVRGGDTRSTVRSITYPDYRLVLQIPSVELDANAAMINNPTSND